MGTGTLEHNVINSEVKKQFNLSFYFNKLVCILGKDREQIRGLKNTVTTRSAATTSRPFKFRCLTFFDTVKLGFILLSPDQLMPGISRTIDSRASTDFEWLLQYFSTVFARRNPLQDEHCLGNQFDWIEVLTKPLNFKGYKLLMNSSNESSTVGIWISNFLSSDLNTEHLR